MATREQTQQAQQVYAYMCDCLDRMDWNYSKEPDSLLVRFNVNGEDLAMRFLMYVDAERQLIRLLSHLPYHICEEKRVDCAVAISVANFGMVDGCFDYDVTDGQIVFRMTQSFLDCTIGEDFFVYMIGCASGTVDRYNDKFYAINKGLLSLTDFVAQE